MEKAKNNQWGSFKQYDFISEGDSPAFLHLVNTGLGNLENPQYGGWGGRLIPSDSMSNRWEDGEKAADFNPYTQKPDLAYAQARWVPTLQNDFAVRADWCIKDFKDANHPPSVFLKHANILTAKPNQKINLKAKASDPDGDKLTFKWWQYEEVGTYKGKIELKNAAASNAFFIMPTDIKKGENVHIILEVTDSKAIPLTRYQRVIVKNE